MLLQVINLGIRRAEAQGSLSINCVVVAVPSEATEFPDCVPFPLFVDVDEYVLSLIVVIFKLL